MIVIIGGFGEKNEVILKEDIYTKVTQIFPEVKIFHIHFTLSSKEASTLPTGWVSGGIASEATILPVA